MHDLKSINIPGLIAELEKHSNLSIAKMSWASGISIATKC